MFTGIVTHKGFIRKVEGDAARRLVIGVDADWLAGTAQGASIACNGICLTVVEQGTDFFTVEASPETLSRTTLADWDINTPVNLERALRMGDELGGHLVTGHVDGIGELIRQEQATGGHWPLWFSLPPGLSPFVAPKGSICIDGVSLTVNMVDAERFSVNIIPHTGHVTTLGTLQAGQKVNLEIDVIARYVQRALSVQFVLQ